MKKNIILAIAATMLFVSMPANAAKSVKVTALSEFNSLFPTDQMKVVVVERAEFKNGLIFEDGTILKGEIFDVKQPKRAKRNATFKFRPITYTYNGKVQKINDPEFVAKYAPYKELDKGAIATSAATTAGGMIFHIPLLSEGVSLVKGMWKNPEDNRLKSGVVQVYKDSPLSYIEEGKDVVITKDTLFVLKFKSSDEEDLDVPADEIKEDTPVNNITNSQQPPVIQEQDDTQAQKAGNIKTPHPDEVLKEVESSSK